MKPAFVVLLMSATQAAAQAVVNEPTISADAALQVATATLAQCRQDGQKVSVTVLDPTGRTKVSIRDDGASPHTDVHSLRKAYTALTYKMPSGEYGKRFTELRSMGPVLLPNITTAPGGLPIRSGERVIGAVGVSGTPGNAGGGEHDEKCAAAGIAKVKF